MIKTGAGPYAFGVLLLLSALVLESAHAQRIVHSTDWLDSEQTKLFLRKMNKNNLFPCEIKGKVQGEELRYKAHYCYFLPSMDYFYSHWGVTDDLLRRYTAFYTSRSMHVYSHSQVVDARGESRHQVTFVRIQSDTEEE